jgi:hypothetical protein
MMRTQALLAECLISAFFAIACLRARGGSGDFHGVTLKNLFALTGRVERLRQSRWQWFSMVLLLVLMRMQAGAPLIAEFTVAVQFIIFLALPVFKDSPRRLSA